MSTTLLVIGSVVVVVGLAGVLAAYLWVIGSAVNHIADTLEGKVGPGAAEIGQHVAALGPAAGGVRAGVSTLAQLAKGLL